MRPIEGQQVHLLTALFDFLQERLKKAQNHLAFCSNRSNFAARNGNAVIAQLVERILGKDEVPSSNLGNSSIADSSMVFHPALVPSILFGVGDKCFSMS